VKRLLLDQGLPRSAARLLTEAGWDVVHVADIGMSRSDDGDILRRAWPRRGSVSRSTRTFMPCS
jgi:predicted nuclease of predicted toxin-antitoxin system